MGKYICAGHASEKGHNYDSGAIGAFNGKKITEAELTVRVRDAVVAELKNRNELNFKTDLDSWDLGQTIKNADTKESDIVLDIHFNAATPAASGVETFIPSASENTLLEKKYAKLLTDGLSTIMKLPNRGVKTEDQCRHKRLGIMRPKGLNMLVEMCFITNQKDLATFFSNETAIVKFICDVLIAADNEIK